MNKLNEDQTKHVRLLEKFKNLRGDGGSGREG